MAVQHGQQHGEPVLFQADGQAARAGRMTGIDQRLNLNQ